MAAKMQRCRDADPSWAFRAANRSSQREFGDEYCHACGRFHFLNTRRNLKVWQRARVLVKLTYELAERLPEHEKFIAVPHLLRAGWSDQNNIAEGYAKLGQRERRRFFDMAIGSLAEIDSMACKLDDLYELKKDLLDGIERLRREINGGLFTCYAAKDKQDCTSAPLQLCICLLTPLATEFS